MVGGGTKIIWSKHNCLTRRKKIQNKYPDRDPGSVQQPQPESQMTDIAKSNNMSPGALCNKWN